MSAQAKRLGVAASQLVMDTGSSTTRANALQVSRLAQRPAGTALLVTSALHMPRATATFRKAGVRVCPMSTDFRAWPQIEWLWVIPNLPSVHRADALIHEWLGLLYYRLKGWL